MTEDEFSQHWKSLVEQKYKQGTVPFTHEENLYFALNCLRGAIPRSGLIGYFENSTGADVHAAAEALRLMNLTRPLSLLESAQEILFGDSPLPNNSVQLEVLPAAMSELEYELASDKWDLQLTPIEEGFYECDEEIYAALCQFAEKRLIKQ